MRNATSALLLIALAVPLSAQTSRATVAVKSAGVPQLTTENPPPPPPPDLTVAAKAEILKNMAASPASNVYFKLSPAVPYLAGKGTLEFHQPSTVWPALESSSFSAPSSRLLYVIHTEGPGRRYLIDCKVSPAGADSPAVYKLSNGKHEVLQTFAANQTHLVWLLDTNDSLWHHYFIYRDGGAAWYFHSCEATRL